MMSVITQVWPIDGGSFEAIPQDKKDLLISG